MSDPNTAHAVTGSIECDAEPATVIGVVANPHHLQAWAPGFADSVAGDEYSGWRVTKDHREFAIRVVVSLDSGTVDVLREVAPGREGGAYLRAVPRLGGGTVLVMTLPVLPGGDPRDVASVVAAELGAIANLVAHAN